MDSLERSEVGEGRLGMEKVKGKCAALLLDSDGTVRTCDGTLLRREVYEPFTMQTAIGSKLGELLSYLVCANCKLMYEE